MALLSLAKWGGDYGSLPELGELVKVNMDKDYACSCSLVHCVPQRSVIVLGEGLLCNAVSISGHFLGLFLSSEDVPGHMRTLWCQEKMQNAVNRKLPGLQCGKKKSPL